METKKTRVAEMAMITVATQFNPDNPSPGWLVVSQPGSCRCKCPKSKQVEAVVNVAANGAVDLVSLLARALVPPDVQCAVWLEQAVGVLVAQLLLCARVGALLPRSGSNISNDPDIVGSCVGRALYALCQDFSNLKRYFILT